MPSHRSWAAPFPPGGSGPACDQNGDGLCTPADFSAWIAAFNGGDRKADQNGDGLVLPNDFASWIANFNVGCP